MESVAKFCQYNQPIKSIDFFNNDTKIIIGYESGENVELVAIGECCSHSYFYNVESFKECVGKSIKSIDQDIDQDTTDLENELKCGETCIKIHLYKITFDNAETYDLIFVNESNGYYNGWMEVKFP